jgi:hydroxymethylglutaryl-CoA lyase
MTTAAPTLKTSIAYPKGQITLREVGLRDGLQMVDKFPSTQGKLDWLALEYAAGMRHFELGTFLPTDRYPMFGDLELLIAKAMEYPDLHGAALVPNKRGAMDAFASGVSELHCVISASEEHNQANLNRSCADSLTEIRQIIELRNSRHPETTIGVGIAMSFGCSISGEVAPNLVLTLAENLYEIGADIVSLADTVGYAGPKQVEHLAREMYSLASGRPFGIHLHDTRGLGLANASAALGQGVSMLDASLGGLGGCPAAPKATGNIVMEDLVFLCQTAGFDTGIDLEKLLLTREVLKREMPAQPLYGALAMAGLPKIGNTVANT